MASLPYKIFDADNHYYEPVDAFTRHLDPDYSRLIQWARIGKKDRLIVNGVVNDYIPNPTFDPIGKPGALVEYFTGADAGAAESFQQSLRDVEPIANRPEYRDRDARLKVMDEQDMEGCWMFPTLAVGMEDALRNNPEGAVALFRSFNRWVEEDWGFSYQNRIHAAAYFTLVDVDEAVEELEWALARDLRVVCIKPGPTLAAGAWTSPFTEEYDPFWSRVNEAGVTVAIHGAANVYSDERLMWESDSKAKAFVGSALGSFISHTHRDVTDTIAAAVCHGLFDRHPRIRLAIVENGSDWLAGMMRKIRMMANQQPHAFKQDPVDAIKKHVWIAPFWEDDPLVTADVMGIERTLLGSDYPHLEGVPNPSSYVDRLNGLSDDDVRKVMRDNSMGLTQRLTSDL